MIDELEKQIIWQNIKTSEDNRKVLNGTAKAIETVKIKLSKDGKLTEELVNCIVVNYKNIKVIIPAEEIGITKTDKKTLRNMIGSELKFIVIESDKLTNTAVASRKKAMELIQRIQLKKYEVGDKVYAKIISVYPKFINVECLGIDIKLKVEDLEYGYVENLSKLYQVGDKIKVAIKEINENDRALKISHKEIQEDPYKNVRKDYVENGEYLAKVTAYSDNRSFCKFKTRDRYYGYTSSLA